VLPRIESLFQRVESIAQRIDAARQILDVRAQRLAQLHGHKLVETLLDAARVSRPD